MTTHEVTVQLTVHHGEYYAVFTGKAADVLGAAAQAAAQTTYAANLFDPKDYMFEARAKFRSELLTTLEAGERYRGYGWNTFEVVE